MLNSIAKAMVMLLHEFAKVAVLFINLVMTLARLTIDIAPIVNIGPATNINGTSSSLNGDGGGAIVNSYVLINLLNLGVLKK